jgi:FtsP/CotA-like multicopper oxidase with cupredoxin domain
MGGLFLSIFTPDSQQIILALRLRSSLLLILIGSAPWIVAGCNGSGGGPVITPAPAPFTFPQPQVRESSGGMLKTTLHAQIADNMLVDQFSGAHRMVHMPTFEGTIPGPTLSVKPGDTLSIDLVNDLPANPKVQRMGFFPHDPYTINLHTHGLSVSPLGISDNIFRQMEPGGTHNPIEIKIPADHPSGTYWYHPHKHGSVVTQMTAGLAGFLILRGGPGTLDAVPEVAAAKDIVMGFQVIRSLTNGNFAFVHQQAQQFGTFPFPGGPVPPTIIEQGVWSTYGLDGAPGRSFFYYTTNGVTNPTLHMRPGEVQRWRLLDATDSDTLLVSLQHHALNIVAMDGITVANTYHLKPEAPVVMSAGSRFDVMVKAGAPGTYQLVALNPLTPASVSPSPQNIDPEPRFAQHSFDFPVPCSHDQTAPLPPPAG